MDRQTETIDPPHGNPHKTSGVDLWLVVGAALYWASIIVQFLLPLSSPSASLRFVDLTVRYLLLALFIGLGLIVPRTLSTTRGRTALASLVVMCSVASCVIPISAAGEINLWDWIRLAIHSFAIAILMVIWGFAFASMDKRDAGQSVAITALISTVFVLILLTLSYFVGTNLLSHIVTALSGCMVLSGHVRFSTKKRPQAEHHRKSLRYFLLSRGTFGVVLGFCLEIPLHLSFEDMSPALLVMGIAALCLAIVAYSRSPDKLYTALPSLLFLAIGITYLPFFEGGLLAAAGASGGLIWFAWAAFSAFQLSDLKERCGMGELKLCLIEKFALSLSIALGIALYRLVEAATSATLSTAALCYAAFAGTFACVVYSSNIAARLVSAHKEDEMRVVLLQTRREREEALYNRIAKEFGLSIREREVFGMLAEGYTRTYIREALGISDGTAKAHIAHVYQKLGVHRKDDLLDLIDHKLADS